MLQLEHVAISYGTNKVVEGFDLTLLAGEIGCLLGASGCGKTSVLRAIAGFEPISEGRIDLHEKNVSRPGFSVAPEKRQIGMVFQDFALFPHLTVAENIAFGIRSLPKVQQRERVESLLTLVELQGLGDRYSHALSGGQQQRVALARAMAPKPDLLLLDEPFSSLDTELRGSLATQVRQILKQQGITALLVTHDKSEAFSMADKLGVMDQGRLLQWGCPATLFSRPASLHVADFIGKGATVKVEYLGDGRIAGDVGDWSLVTNLSVASGTSLSLLLRPHQVKTDPTSELKARVLRQIFRGADYLYELQLPGGELLLSSMPLDCEFSPGQSLGLSLDLTNALLFDAANGHNVLLESQ